jgi:hypothetical protein
VDVDVDIDVAVAGASSSNAVLPSDWSFDTTASLGMKSVEKADDRGTGVCGVGKHSMNFEFLFGAGSSTAGSCVGV